MGIVVAERSTATPSTTTRHSRSQSISQTGVLVYATLISWSFTELRAFVGRPLHRREYRYHIDDPTRDWHWEPDKRRRLPEVIRLCFETEIDRLTTMLDVGDIEPP